MVRHRWCFVLPSARLHSGRERVCFALLSDTFYIRHLLFHRYGIVRIAMNRHCRFLPLSHAELAKLPVKANLLSVSFLGMIGVHSYVSRAILYGGIL